MQNQKIVSIKDNIAPVFYSVWADKTHPYVIMKGGRSSTKSSVISLRLVKDMLDDPELNVICLRAVAGTLRGSCYEQIKWAIDKLNVTDEFIFRKAPLEITHKKNGTKFKFFGLDK
jgi:phage terminase large subunit